MQDIRQSLEYTDYLKKEGWNTERINKTNYFIRKMPFGLNVMKVQRPEKIDFDTIDKLCRKYGVFQIIIEPKKECDTIKLKTYGLKLSRSPFLPTKTLQIDLTQTQNQIFKAFKKHTKQAVKRGDLKLIKKYSTPNEIKLFREAWKKSVNYKRYVPSLNQLLNLKKSFPQNKSLFLASHNISGRIIGGVLFTTSLHGKSKDIAYYWYGFTNKEGRSSLSQYSLLWQGILWAKKQGYKVFDFEGIYDDRFPSKSWLGFSHFKKSFGGTEVLYPGCYTRFRLPI